MESVISPSMLGASISICTGRVMLAVPLPDPALLAVKVWGMAVPVPTPADAAVNTTPAALLDAPSRVKSVLPGTRMM